MTQSSTPPQENMQTRPSSFSRPSLATLFTRFPVTYTLILITLLIYIAQELSIFLLDGDIVISYGAKINQAIYDGEYWRFLTPIFVHAGIWHIFVNMYSLNAIGPAVEGFFKSPRMLAVYLLSGITSVIFSLAFTTNASVGASGAIFGLLGSLGTFLFLHKDSLGEAGKAYLRRIALVALLNLALGLAPSIDNWGHLGGLLAGSALAWYLGPRFELSWISDPGTNKMVEQRPWEKVWQRIFPALAVIALLAYLAMLSPFSQ